MRAPVGRPESSPSPPWSLFRGHVACYHSAVPKGTLVMNALDLFADRPIRGPIRLTPPAWRRGAVAFLALDPKGNLYIADGINVRIRKVNTAGIISTVAGNGSRGFSGDGGRPRPQRFPTS